MGKTFLVAGVCALALTATTARGVAEETPASQPAPADAEPQAQPQPQPQPQPDPEPQPQPVPEPQAEPQPQPQPEPQPQPPPTTSSDKGAIAGQVVDKNTGEPLIEAQVTVLGPNRKVLTDIDGNYRVELPPGVYELRVWAEL